MRTSRYIAFFVGLILIGSACAEAGEAPDSAEEPTDQPGTTSTLVLVETTDSRTSTSEPNQPLESVEAARAYLAANQGVSLDEVVIDVHEEVVWPDGSLGCPQKGMSYTQALVNGSRLILSVDGRSFSFHSGRTGVYKYCPLPSSPVAENPNA